MRVVCVNIQEHAYHVHATYVIAHRPVTHFHEDLDLSKPSPSHVTEEQEYASFARGRAPIKQCLPYAASQFVHERAASRSPAICLLGSYRRSAWKLQWIMYRCTRRRIAQKVIIP
jgi:hypothetical protein